MCEDLSDLSIANMPERAIAIQEDYKSAGESRSKARGGGGYKKPWRVIDETAAEEKAPGVRPPPWVTRRGTALPSDPPPRRPASAPPAPRPPGARGIRRSNPGP